MVSKVRGALHRFEMVGVVAAFGVVGTGDGLDVTGIGATGIGGVG